MSKKKKKEKPFVTPTWSNHPVLGEQEYFVCSECGEEVEFIEDGSAVCPNHGEIEDE